MDILSIRIVRLKVLIDTFCLLIKCQSEKKKKNQISHVTNFLISFSIKKKGIFFLNLKKPDEAFGQHICQNHHIHKLICNYLYLQKNQEYLFAYPHLDKKYKFLYSYFFLGKC